MKDAKKTSASTAAVRVLLVEDSVEDAELMVREIERAGFETQWRRVQRESELRAALEEQWDLFLSDYAMPSFDGLRAFEMCQQAQPFVPFIFVSGRLGEERAVAAMRAGASDYIVKTRLHRLRGAVVRELDRAGERRDAVAARQALAVERRRFQSVADAAVIALLDVDFRAVRRALEADASAAVVADGGDRIARVLGDAVVSYANVAARHLLPVPATLDGAPSLTELLHFADDTAPRELIAALRTGGRTFHARARLRRPSAPDLTVLLACHIPARLDELSNVVLCLFDLSEYASLEEQLRYARRVDALGRLSAGIAHDFNNVLQVIQSSADTIARKRAQGQAEAIERELGAIESATRSARNLTERLLQFSRGGAEAQVVVDLGEVVDGMMGMLERLSMGVVGLEHARATAPQPVAGGRAALEQIVMNLTLNAVEASEERAQDMAARGLDSAGPPSVVVSTTVEVVDRPTGPVEPGEYVRLTVADQGPGMDEQTLARAFEPLYTTKGDRGGSGLGLATVAGLVRGLGGFIDVDSSPGRGTRFHVYLPHRGP